MLALARDFVWGVGVRKRSPVVAIELRNPCTVMQDLNLLAGEAFGRNCDFCRRSVSGEWAVNLGSKTLRFPSDTFDRVWV